MTSYHHAKLPESSALLSGRAPRDESTFQSSRVQILYQRTNASWSDPASHLHHESDECFIVLYGTVTVEVEGHVFQVGPHEYCFFPRGVHHSILETGPPVEVLIIRAPSADDKVYRDGIDHSTDFLA